MSLRDTYFNGSNGLQQQMDTAFQAGIAYIGAGTPDSSTLDLADRTGANLSPGTGQPGLYFSYSSPSIKYIIWLQAAGEIAPSVAGNLVQVNILTSDNAPAVAAKIAAAMNLITTDNFNCDSVASVVQLNNTVSGPVISPVSVGTLGGIAAVNQVKAGVAATGNYMTLQTSLQAAAAQGQTNFIITVQGTGSVNSGYLRNNDGHNLLLKSFFAGIQAGLAAQDIYDYHCHLHLNVKDNVATNVDFHFKFDNHLPVAYPNGNPNCTHPQAQYGYGAFANNGYSSVY